MNESQQDEISRLTLRVKRLERSLILLLFIGLVGVTVGFSRSQAPNAIQARNFEVVDSLGEVVAFFGYENYHPSYDLGSELEGTIVRQTPEMVIGPLGSSVAREYGQAFLDHSGLKVSNQDGLFSFGEKGISASSKVHLATFILGLSESGPNLFLNGRNGSMGLGIGADGPSMDLTDSDQGLMVMDIGADGPSLRLMDQTGGLRAALGATRLTLSATESIEIRPPASLVLFGTDGKVIWSAPIR